MNLKSEKLIAEQFATNLKMWRINRNLTQTDLGNAIDVDRVQIAKWETQGILPRVPTVLKIAKVLKITLADLFDNC